MKSILLVDDNEPLLKALTRQLGQHADEWQVKTATNGIDAVRLVAANAFDLLITDLVMPDQDGLGTINAVRKTRPSMKIIAMTGGGHHVGADFLQIARALGASEILTKPFSKADLIASVRRVLASPTESVHLAEHDETSMTPERRSPQI